MAWWEHNFLFDAGNPFFAQISWCGRYIDDLLFIAGVDVADIHTFQGFLNTHTLGLKFSVSFNRLTIPFLNVVLKVDGNRMPTANYRKPTAGNTILHAESCHPPHKIKNIPLGEMIRARRNCSNMQDFLEEYTNIANRLNSRKYPHWCLKRTLVHTQDRDRQTLLHNKQKQKCHHKSSVIFSTMYNVDYNQILISLKEISKHYYKIQS